MRLLVVEDEKALANVLKKGLEEEGFTVEWPEGAPVKVKMSSQKR